MSNSDISVRSVLIKYRENGQVFYMVKGQNGGVVGIPTKKGALLFTPTQARDFINHMKKINFPFQCGPEAVK